MLSAQETPLQKLQKRWTSAPLLIVEGQSLAGGIGATEYITPASSLVRSFVGTGGTVGASRALTSTTALPNALTSLVAMAESSVSSFGQTVLTSCLEYLQTRTAEHFGVDVSKIPSWVGSSCCNSGRAIAEFQNGQWPMDRITEAGTAIRNLKGDARAWIWMQGESNNVNVDAGERAAYVTALRTLLASVRTALGSTDLVQMGYQTAGGMGSTVDTQGSTMAQWDLFKSGEYNIVSPVYFMPDNQSVHINANGQQWLGRYFGRWLFDYYINNIIRKPLYPSAAALSGGVCTLTFASSEGDLVLDTINYFPANDTTTKCKLGFCMLDGSTRVDIGTPTVVNHNQVQFTCPSSFSGIPKVRYACDYRGNDWNAAPKGYGNLHDSSPDRALVRGYSLPLHNFCVNFDWTF